MASQEDLNELNDKAILYSTPVYVIMCVVLIFFSLTTLTIIIKDYRLRNTSSPLFIANLALVDLCLAVFTAFGVFTYAFKITFKLWTMTEIQVSFFIVVSTLSLLSTFANSVDRYIYIRYSIQYHRIMTLARTKWIIVCIWVFSILFGFIPMVYNILYGSRRDLYPPYPSIRIYGNYMPLWIIYCLTSWTSEVMFIILFIMVRKRKQSVVSSRLTSFSPQRQMETPETNETSTDSAQQLQINRECESNSNSIPDTVQTDTSDVGESKTGLITEVVSGQLITSDAKKDSYSGNDKQTLKTDFDIGKCDVITIDIDHVLERDKHRRHSDSTAKSNTHTDLVSNSLQTDNLTLTDNPNTFITIPDNLTLTDNPNTSITIPNIDETQTNNSRSVDLITSATENPTENSNSHHPHHHPHHHLHHNTQTIDGKPLPAPSPIVSTSSNKTCAEKSKSKCLLEKVTRSIKRCRKTPRSRTRRNCHDNTDFKTAKTLFILLGVYILLWSPTYVTFFLLTVFDIPLDRYFMWTYLLAVLNSIIDFFVYPMRIQSIRTTFIDACKRFRRSCGCKR